MLDNSIRGFAYIEFEEAEDAEEAIFNMNESELYNRVIKVEVAKPHRGLGGLDSSLPGIPPPHHGSMKTNDQSGNRRNGSRRM